MYRKNIFEDRNYSVLFFLCLIFLLVFMILFTVFVDNSRDSSDPKELSGKRPQNIVIVVFDALRYDRVSVSGYERNVTPNLDRFIKSSYYFKRSYAPGPWTIPSLSTVFTGKYPSSTGVFNWSNKICREETTFAEIAKKKGYNTAGFTGGGALNPVFGFSQGFSLYSFNKLYLENNLDLASEWLSNNSKENNLIFIHGFDVHSPYFLPEKNSFIFGREYEGEIPEYSEDLKRVNLSDYNLSNKKADNINIWRYWAPVNFSSPEDRQHIRNMYDNCLYYADRAFGRFMEKLKDRGLYDNSLIIVMSDHGEEIFDHGGIKHENFYEETIRTFLAVKLPKQSEGLVYEGLVSLKDLYPMLITKMDHGNLNRSKGIIESLMNKNKSKYIFSERYNRRMILDGNIKVIEVIKTNNNRKKENSSRWRFKAYNLSQDPSERVDIVSNLSSPHFKKLTSKLDQYLERNRANYCSSGFNLSKGFQD